MAVFLATGVGIVTLTPVHAQALPKADFSWSPNVGEYQSIDAVTFANGAEIRSERDSTSQRCDFSRLVSRSPTSTSFNDTSICDSIVHINAAWPSAKNAKVAIVSANCGGSICHTYSDYYVVLIDQKNLRISQVGTAFIGPRGKPTTFGFTFQGSEIKQSVISNLYGGDVNDLGDLTATKRTYFKGKGYVHDKFNSRFLSFVGEHPESFMEDEVQRKGLVASTGPNNFRAIRAALSGPGSSGLVDGRFVLMEACQKSNCDSVWGAVVLDGFTGDAFAVVLQDRTTEVFHYGTRPLDSGVDRRWIDMLEAGDGRYLSLKDGRLLLNRP
ncbi:hypothetical protein [Hydrogenophaga sp. 2FB]|uniref:hypothetical protein n=1 Tax=Hydrogenophaga sp. 2FB TaxID=2502187 RepID=UPI0010F5E899|nr:hypothetical protein [Hydrogenophaga sp. 2FB]